MPTASTAEVRSWARGRGLAVGDRGRLAPDILAAYAAAKNTTAPAKPTTTTKTSAKRSPAKNVKRESPAGRPSTKKNAPAGKPAAALPARGTAATRSAPTPAAAKAPSPSTELEKILSLEVAVAALTSRVAALESRGNGKKRFARKP